MKIKIFLFIFFSQIFFINASNVIGINQKKIDTQITEDEKPEDNSNDDKNVTGGKKIEPTKIIKPFEKEYYDIFASFTFSKKNLDTIQKALAVYNQKENFKNDNKNNSKEILLEEEKSEELQNVDKNIGNLYLNSIIYISNKKWIIWLNNNKITSEDKNEDPEFIIEKIDNDSVTFIWNIIKGKWKYINAENAINPASFELNEKTNKVELKLTLSPNQTFVASEDRIIDGKFKETVFIIQNDLQNLNSPTEEINLEELLQNIQ